MLSKKQLFSRGMLDIAPHMLSVIPFGIICGAIGVDLGFNPYLVYAMSIIIFGGASQIVFLQLLSGGASSLVAVTSVGVINSRHLLYGAVLSEYLEKLSFIKKLLISYVVVDQGRINPCVYVTFECANTLARFIKNLLVLLPPGSSRLAIASISP